MSGFYDAEDVVTLDQLDRVHPNIRSLITSFMNKSRYPFVMVTTGTAWVVKADGTYESLPAGVHFYDPKTPEMANVGSLVLDNKSGGALIRVRTRHELYSRYRSSDDRRSVRTKDEKKALREALKYIAPYTTQEIVKFHSQHQRRLVDNWLSEVRRPDGIPVPVLLVELENLVRQGVTFITPEFNKFVDESVAAYKEAERRRNTKVLTYFVKFGTDGVLVHDATNNTPTTYPTLENTPEFVREAISMLDIMGVEKEVTGLGIKTTPTTYWVMKHD